MRTGTTRWMTGVGMFTVALGTAWLLYGQDRAPQTGRGGRGEGGAPAEARGRGRGGIPEPPLWLSDDDYLRWPLPASEQKYAVIDGFRIKRHINDITAFSRRSRDDGNQYWGRITGTPYDKMTTDYVASEFRRIGLEQVRIQDFDLPPQWFPTSWEVTLAGSAQASPLKSAFPLFNSVGTPAVDLEPVWIGTGTAADFLGRDVRGKAAVVYGFPNPGGRNDTALTNGTIALAERAGAAAVIIVLGIPGNVMNEPQAGGTEAPAKIPVFMLGSDDGFAIRQMIERQQSPKLKMRLQVESRTGLKTASVWGMLPGMTDENVVVMAHTEAFFEGAMDNASGVGTMIELAEYYSKLPRAERKRTMVFFTSSAHHAPSGEEAGIRWIHNHRQDLFQKTALIVNCEHTSQVQTYLIGNSLVGSNTISARRWYVGGSDALKKIVATTFKNFGIAIYSRPETRPGGELGNVYMDAPSVHVIDHTIYHTDLDVPLLVPEPGLEAVARAFAKIIDEVNRLPLSNLRI